VVAPGRQLDHPYSLMTEYVCPVGALTAQDFRFKARVWFLRSARTVCVGCATGCSSFTDYDPRNQTVYRYRPRENLEVNKYWMCDDGMLDYRRIHENRVLRARVGTEETSRDEALLQAAELLRRAAPQKIALVLSAQHSNEDNYALLTLAREHLKISDVFVSGQAPGRADDILIHADKNPNHRGVAGLCGVPPKRFGELVAGLAAGTFTHVLALGSYVSEPDKTEAFKGATVVALATHDGPIADHARVVLPVSSWAESDGTFVNAKGMAQETQRAILPHGDSLPAWRMVGLLAKALGIALPFGTLDKLRAAMTPASGPSSARGVGVQLGA
jgi:NADH-quinone oxidoreductase subunit G